MSKVIICQNRQNESKFLEIHMDGYGHYTVRQYMRTMENKRMYNGDQRLHRWKKKALETLLQDYVRVGSFPARKGGGS